MPAQKLHRNDWKEGTVYLFQFPRAKHIPSPSPFSLKLETWLRINDIPYENVSTEFKKTSSKGQVPFIEFNGRQIGDSNQIIPFLTKELNKETVDTRLSKEDQAYRQAFHHLLENSIFWAIVANRKETADFFFTEDGMLGHFSGIKKTLTQHIGPVAFKRKLKNMSHVQGYGRNTVYELEEQMIKDLDALSTFLGSKHYFFGNEPSSLDVTAFGQLCQVLYTPLVTKGVVPHMHEHNKNLVDFVERIKAHYWPDWERATSALNFSSDWKHVEPIAEKVAP
ncbi:unnamed protein product, partial [Mesorhabditis spiculigera]